MVETVRIAQPRKVLLYAIEAAVIASVTLTMLALTHSNASGNLMSVAVNNTTATSPSDTIPTTTAPTSRLSATSTLSSTTSTFSSWMPSATWDSAAPSATWESRIRPRAVPIQPIAAVEISGDPGFDLGNFEILWLGPTGACCKLSSGVTICSGSSFLPNFQSLYTQATIGDMVQRELPKSVSGAPIGLLIGVILLCFAFVFFFVALNPASYGSQWFPGISPATLDVRHQWLVAFGTGLCGLATFCLAAGTIVMRNIFGTSAAKIGADSPSFTVKLGIGFRELWASTILVGVVVFAGILLISEDFRLPWWYRTPTAPIGSNMWSVTPAMDYSLNTPGQPVMNQMRPGGLAGDVYGGVSAPFPNTVYGGGLMPHLSAPSPPSALANPLGWGARIVPQSIRRHLPFW